MIAMIQRIALRYLEAFEFFSAPVSTYVEEQVSVFEESCAVFYLLFEV